MAAIKSLNLLVIDEEQLYAERLIELLGSYYQDINLGFLDDKSELLRLFRQQWDVLVFIKAYDMSFTDVVALVQEQDIDLPMICLMNDDNVANGQNAQGMPSIIDSTMVRALSAEHVHQVVMAICLQYESLRTRRKFANLRHVLSESEQRANILIKNSKSAVAYIDEGIHIFANDPYLELFGFDNMEEIIGVPVIDLISGKDSVKGFKQFLRHFSKGNRDQVEFEFESRRTDGSTFEAKLQLAAATLEGTPVTQIIIQQNRGADAEELAKQLAAAQRKDSLTGLDNRQGFEDYLSILHQRVLDGKCQAAMLYIRLDSIGKINTSLGLQGVDATVKQVAYTLDEYFEEGYVSRFSDNTFAVLLEDVRVEELKKIAEGVRERIADLLINVDNRTTTTTISIGMVMMDQNSPSQTQVVERAMEACQQVQMETQNAGNAIHLYDPKQHANSDDEALAEYLVNAISHNRFELLYQPIYDIDTDSSNLFEVYLRLPLADGSSMSPDQFISVAKERKLLDKMDRWILINACKHLSVVRREYPSARLLIQLTTGSLSDEKLPNVVSQLIKAVGGEPGALTLQFNEQDIVDYLIVAKKQFTALMNVGCSVSIHNFGSTTKSIDTADYVQPSMVRLAKSYVDDLSSEENIETVKTLIASANEHGFNVLMPYIEDASTMSVSWSVGARYLQGYYLQKPTTSISMASEQANS